ncbi:MEMO1 family protein [Archaeoglobus sp.]
MRRPAVAGMFYPSNVESLMAMLREFVDYHPDDSVIACVSPHAGYVYSGRTAGRVYSLIPQVETYVIVGPNHTGYGSPVALSTDTWLTPLGEVEVDTEFVEAMPKKIVDLDETAHRFEHSLEVQVPFLQYINMGRNFKIVPICMGMQDEETAREVAEEIITAKEETGKDVVVVASSDMHHYLPDEECRRRDKVVIEAILSMDVSKFYDVIYRMQASVCGYGPIAVAMIYSNYHKAIAELVDYSTSGDVEPMAEVVGYAGIVFRA